MCIHTHTNVQPLVNKVYQIVRLNYFCVLKVPKCQFGCVIFQAIQLMSHIYILHPSRSLHLLTIALKHQSSLNGKLETLHRVFMICFTLSLYELPLCNLKNDLAYGLCCGIIVAVMLRIFLFSHFETVSHFHGTSKHHQW